MKSFLQGKKMLEMESLKPPAGGATLSAQVGKLRSASICTPEAASAQVEVVREGDKIVRLVVHCVCGERVEIECLYSAGR
jgi:hypothetical protein